MAITCRVQAAAQFGTQGDAAAAQSTCAQVPEGTWQQECHFRAGEELGAAGHTVDGLTHCAQAGRFSRNCLTHTIWRMPRDPDVTPATAPADITASWSELSAQVNGALANAEEGVLGEGEDVLRAQFGHNLYVGSGQADPGAARMDVGLSTETDGDWRLAGALRTGFALETARLLNQQDGTASVQAIVDIWNQRQAPPQGEPVPDHLRLGRYHTPILSPFESGEPHLPLYGGGLRLAAEDPEEDITIAALEAIYWLPTSPADAFVPWLDDPRPRVRRTAAKLVRLTQGVEVDVEALALSLQDRHNDEGVRWHMKDALERRSFEEREARPPPTSSNPAMAPASPYGIRSP